MLFSSPDKAIVPSGAISSSGFPVSAADAANGISMDTVVTKMHAAIIIEIICFPILIENSPLFNLIANYNIIIVLSVFPCFL